MRSHGEVTIEEALQRASLCLREAGLERPRDEAEALLMHLLGWGRLALFLKRSAALPGHIAGAFQAALQRRADGEPLAYITGEKEFYGLNFAVNRAVLVPRPETELLVDAALQWARPREEKIRGVDLGCGCGNIAVALACHLPEAAFFAADLSPEALQVARANAGRHGVRDRIRFEEGDYLDAFAGLQPPPRFNLVLSNPPYISSGELKILPAAIRDYEPLLSLDGGPDGLAAYRRILARLPYFVKRPGLMVLEIGSTQGDAVLALCREQPLFHRVALQKDYQGLPRILTGLF